MLRFMELFVLLVAVILRVRGQCPTLCTCPSSYVANCASAALTKIPTDRFDLYMENLDVSDNSLASLNKTSLSGILVISLIQLNVSRNHIRDIHEETFVGQSRLQTVDLSSNNITYIEPKTFTYNPSLEMLSVSSNKFLVLPEEGPFIHSGSLRVLYLSACDLSHIPPQTFKSVPNLEELYISHNRIETLRPLQGNGRLTLIDVSNNYLISLDPGVFTVFPKLHRLNLSYNRLTDLDIIPQLPNKTCSEELNGNPWVCNCSTFHTAYSWCHDKGVDLRLLCSSPPKYKGVQWTVYGKEFCGDDNEYVEQMEGFVISADRLQSIRMYENYEIQQASMYIPTEIQELDTNVSHNYYLYFFLVIIILCLCCIAVIGGMAVFLSCVPSVRRVPVHSDVQESHI
ncbi:phospholipase A2 inhibitor-like [Cryptotermes secundus]|uniref:phospholipase A2 inhibitor-like n=1 Tax=Cryptotermes secundus TaxID=105785 RepID=UPI001454C56B|nr:phospholipase A2 inhibitor-like [Cryptotermes secundus]